MAPHDLMPIEMKHEQMWTLLPGNGLVRLHLSPLPVAGVSQRLNVKIDFDANSVDQIIERHLVQEHGIDRTDVFIRAPGKANTAGVRPAGADVESGHPGVEKHGEPELSGPIEVSVDCDSRRSTVIRSALEKDGATLLRME